VKIGNLSREGYGRNQEANKALDHDYQADALLVPFGILDVLSNQLWIYFGESKETSDFVVDCLDMWWEANCRSYSHLEELIIELDGGRATRSNRKQFIKRIVEFSQKTNLKIRLVYYPPYHSKYNPIERCWAALENYWNGAILDSVSAALSWAENMRWRGIKPIVKLVSKIYQKGVNPTQEELEISKKYWYPSQTLSSWDVNIIPYG